ncbi:hypothetical protein PsYK624_124570 [Phanerochaete sordida]|uniref:Uncharacterized protein n=1 Tax=Phanerochaete sordida TaxID=48140 RepID=A0A9P3GJV0_9APHY|nr:hypothetical protein PsYK624_124570 [Phanerochaete sordida]
MKVQFQDNFIDKLLGEDTYTRRSPRAKAKCKFKARVGFTRGPGPTSYLSRGPRKGPRQDDPLQGRPPSREKKKKKQRKQRRKPPEWGHQPGVARLLGSATRSEARG